MSEQRIGQGGPGKSRNVGENHGQAKLNEVVVRHIRSRDYYRGLYVELADRFGVSPRTISDVRNHVTWRKVR